MDIQRSTGKSLRELHLFAGAGGGILGGKLLGHTTVCAVEWEPYAQAVLLARQNDGTPPPFPIWDDVQTFDGRPWCGIVDVVAGGFPCQDISAAGKRAGIMGKRSGMWSHMARVVGEVRPKFVFIENSPMLINRGLDRVLADLASMGYDAKWLCLSGSDIGAPHKRDGLWILAWDYSKVRRVRSKIHKKFNVKNNLWKNSTQLVLLDGCKLWEDSQSGIHAMGNGLAHPVEQIAALGNGQIPRVAATAFTMLMNGLSK